MDENLQNVFTGYGCVPVLTNYGCTFYIHIDAETIRDCRERDCQVQLGLCNIEGFPLVHILIKIYDRSTKPLQFDCLFNVFNESEYKRVLAFKDQEEIVFYWYDENLKYIRSSEVQWTEDNRRRAAEIVEATHNMMEKSCSEGFESARKKFFEGV
jgi:hypothetical protein